MLVFANNVIVLPGFSLDHCFHSSTYRGLSQLATLVPLSSTMPMTDRKCIKMGMFLLMQLNCVSYFLLF